MKNTGLPPLPELSNHGERGLPPSASARIEDQLAYLKHRAMYAWARTWGQTGRVLDLGCGEGYGSQILADASEFVAAADYSPVAARHVQATYGGPRLSCLCCDGERLAFSAGSFDLVVSFEVIEHLEDVTAYLLEVRRILKSHGTFIVSTPNRKLRLLPFQRPWNPHHRREYSARQFAQLLGSVFPSVQLRGLAAIPEVVRVEKRRIGKILIASYGGRIARGLLPTTLFARLQQSVRKRRTSATLGHDLGQSVGIQTQGERFGFDSFFLVDQDLDACINLIGICTL